MFTKTYYVENFNNLCRHDTWCAILFWGFMQQIHTRHTIEGAINHVAKKSCEFKSKTLFFRQLELNIFYFFIFLLSHLVPALNVHINIFSDKFLALLRHLSYKLHFVLCIVSWGSLPFTNTFYAGFPTPTIRMKHIYNKKK